MPAAVLANPRDLCVELLGHLLFVERRLHDALLPALAAAVSDDELKQGLREHQQETAAHVDRVERAFRLLDVAPTSNLFEPLEAAAQQHHELAGSLVDTRLADLFHAHAALHTEHMEMASYRTLLPLVPREVADLLRASYDDEGHAAKLIVKAIDRLADAG
jgi:ferritin-like metal-binding protein YciE